jgi:hypothetical protein
LAAARAVGILRLGLGAAPVLVSGQSDWVVPWLAGDAADGREEQEAPVRVLGKTHRDV